MSSSATEIGIPDLCQYKNAPLEVHTFNSNLAPVEADISYKCFSETCSIGETENGILKGNFPQCANGYVVARAEGYEEGSLLHSTTSDVGVVNIFLEKSYDINAELRLDGQAYSGNALIMFSRDGSTKTAIYPEQTNVVLSEGEYEIQVYIYKNSSLEFQETTKTECIEIPAGGIGGLLACLFWKSEFSITCIARPEAVEELNKTGFHLQSKIFGDFIAHPRFISRLDFKRIAFITL